ncbi:MAG: TIGR02099 family protein [Betaproteobacteria bacterium]|nr:TIGR02099 family protein [Betaproteobacteria bacterium]
MAWLWHHCVWIASGALIVLAVAVLALRYAILPNIDGYRGSVEQAAGKALGQRVSIGQLTSTWEGFWPALKLENVVVHDQAGRAALQLPRVDGTLSWRSLALWRPHFRAIDLHDSALDLRRDKNGVLFVSGIAMGGEAGPGGFSEWLLRQRDIEVHNASIRWTDELRGAPALNLEQVRLHLVNRGNRHRFAVKAVPPREVAGPLDVRGDFTGTAFNNLADWHGRLYLDLDQANLAAWRTWAPLPFEIGSGAGALRAWASIRDQTLQEMTADVRLSGVRMRVERDMPELDLAALNGRLVWKKTPTSHSVSTTQLALTTGKLTLPPTDLNYRAATDAQGVPLSGEIKVGVIDIAPVLALADHFVLGREARKRLLGLSPQGRLADVTARWEGALPAPAKFNARGRFENLSVNHDGALPGVRGVSGTLEASEKGGTLQLAAKRFSFELPAVFQAPLEFDSITGQAQWTGDALGDKGVQFKLNNVAFANADVAGTVAGSMHIVPGQPGVADLSGTLSRAQADKMLRYLPLQAGRKARPWMEEAFVAGHSRDVKFRLKGDLRDFPFDDAGKGTFQINAAISGGKLHYAAGWPDIDGIEGEVTFRGQHMTLLAKSGAIGGTRLSDVRAEIPELDGKRVLTVSGNAQGATQSFLQFIQASPVAGYIDRFTDGMQGEGNGTLRLRLELPLRDLKDTRVAGSYQLAGNRLILDPALPPLEQVNGTIEFTENGVNIPSASAQFFGGPLTIAGANQRDGTIQMKLQGRADPDVLRRAGGPAWLTHLRGVADWTGIVNIHKKTVDLVLESNLQGVTSSLPAPFAKTANEAWATRIERRFLGNNRDQLLLSAGDLVSAHLVRHADGKRTVIERGVVRLGGGAVAQPTREGVLVSGGLKSVNLDTWIRFAGLGAPKPAVDAAAAAPDLVYTITGIDVRLGEFELYDRKFGELNVSATAGGAQTTRYRLLGRDIEGIVDWNSGGRGRLVAQLQKLNLPAAPPAAAVKPGQAKPAPHELPQLPALDIVAEQFQMGAKPLGKLDLKATPQGRDWRIEKLSLIAPDGTLNAEGVWQAWLTHPRTQVNVQWTISDAGSTLGRLGYPGAVRGGTAEIGGTLAWAGGPYQIDYPTLSGKFAFRAERGQFRQMEPGTGKLLGIISLQSLPRRLSLDFRDVFSRGFAFDEILGEIRVDQGIATTDKFLITGPAARVLMGGSVDLARETQKLDLKVSPHVSEGVAIATGLLGGPIAALATFVAQKLLKDPFGDLVALRYNVTGTWADPVVTKIEAPELPNRSAD